MDYQGYNDRSFDDLEGEMVRDVSHFVERAGKVDDVTSIKIYEADAEQGAAANP